MTLLMGVGMMSARDRVTHDINVLPTPARTTLSTHFKKVAVNHIKIDDNLLGKPDYEVILDNGTEIDFDGEGRLKEVDCSRNGVVPAGLIVKPVSDYIKRNYKNARIIGYEVKSNGYEVELNNGIEVKFDRSGNFRGEDR